jgi:hypothetical protein
VIDNNIYSLWKQIGSQLLDIDAIEKFAYDFLKIFTDCRLALYPIIDRSTTDPISAPFKFYIIMRVSNNTFICEANIWNVLAVSHTIVIKRQEEVKL